MKSLAKAYPFVYHVEVEFRHLDPMGHVNHAVFFTYMESARVRYFTKFFEGVSSPLDMPLILAEACCTYRSPAYFGEPLVVGCGIVSFGRKSFRMAFRIDGDDDRLVARGHSVIVMYDYGTAGTILVPDAFKEQVNEFQKGWTLEPLPPGAADR